MESEKAIQEFEDIVFRGKMPRKKARKIEVVELPCEGLEELTVMRNLSGKGLVAEWCPF